MIAPGFPALVDVEKARANTVAATQRRIDAAAKPYAAAIAAWLRRFALAELAHAKRDPHGYVAGHRHIAKADTPEELLAQLERLMRMFGLRTAAGAANRTAGRVVVPGDLLTGGYDRVPNIRWFWELQGQAVKRAHDLMESTRQAARESVRAVLRDAAREQVQPSAGEMARRISSAFLGPGEAARERRVHATEADRAFAFSPERAALIARTESTINENTGIVAGYQALGVEEIEWLAYRDGRSGDRHHERMHGERVKLGELFTLPSGARLRFPGDPSGPIGELANCRCTSRAVLPKRRG